MKKITSALILSGILASALTSHGVVDYAISETAPGADVRASFEADVGLNKTMSPRNTTDPGTTPPPRTVGQTFKIDTDATVTKVAVRMGNNVGIISGDGGVSHNLLLGFAMDSDGDNTVDTPVGNISSYDFTAFQSVKDSYIIFEFDGIGMVAGRTYSFELAFEAKDASHNIAIYRSDPNGADLYADGGQISKPNYEVFPSVGISTNAVADLTFYVVGTPGDVGPGSWAGYDILNEAGDVDTTTFLGFVNVSNGDWVWSYSLEGWMYLPEEIVTENGAWSYVINP